MLLPTCPWWHLWMRLFWLYHPLRNFLLLNVRVECPAWPLSFHSSKPRWHPPTYCMLLCRIVPLMFQPVHGAVYFYICLLVPVLHVSVERYLATRTWKPHTCCKACNTAFFQTLRSLSMMADALSTRWLHVSTSKHTRTRQQRLTQCHVLVLHVSIDHVIQRHILAQCCDGRQIVGTQLF